MIPAFIVTRWKKFCGVKMMNKRMVAGFTRISKRAAEKRYNAGEVVILCPVKLRPGFPYFPEIPVKREEISQIGGDGFNIVVPRSRDFETVANAFSFYNCSAGAGKYPAFYVKEV